MSLGYEDYRLLLEVDPDTFLEKMFAMEAQLNEIKRLAKDHCSEHGTIVGNRFTFDYPKPNPIFSKAFEQSPDLISDKEYQAKSVYGVLTHGCFSTEYIADLCEQLLDENARIAGNC